MFSISVVKFLGVKREIIEFGIKNLLWGEAVEKKAGVVLFSGSLCVCVCVVVCVCVSMCVLGGRWNYGVKGHMLTNRTAISLGHHTPCQSQSSH